MFSYLHMKIAFFNHFYIIYIWNYILKKLYDSPTVCSHIYIWKSHFFNHFYIIYIWNYILKKHSMFFYRTFLFFFYLFLSFFVINQCLYLSTWCQLVFQIYIWKSHFFNHFYIIYIWNYILKKHTQGNQFSDYVPESLIECLLCSLCGSHASELVIFDAVHSMLRHRSDQASLEALSLIAARLPGKHVPRSFVVEYIQSERSGLAKLMEIELRYIFNHVYVISMS